MMSRNEKEPKSGIPCSPPLSVSPTCDTLVYYYRLPQYIADTKIANRFRVEVILKARLRRCPGELVIGDLIYTTTLFPGEKVKLFASDRRSRFTFDSSTNMSYRTEQTQEEHFYMASMSQYISDLTCKDTVNSTNTTKAYWDVNTETSGILETLFGSPSIDVSGSHGSKSTYDFAHELRQHVEASHYSAELATRASTAVSIGEVATRTHKEGETDDHFESVSRNFENPNRCHSVTYYFYRINKKQKITFEIELADVRTLDLSAPSKVTNNPFASRGLVHVIPAGITATDKQRNDIMKMASTPSQTTVTEAATAKVYRVISTTRIEPRDISLDDAEKTAHKELGIDKENLERMRQRFKELRFEQETSLPTPGIYLRGSLDECNICEPARVREIELELEKRKLENELLKRKIELLDQSAEYRSPPLVEPQPMPQE